MATARRFVFFEKLKSGEERFMLANLDALYVPGRPTARIIAEMGRVPGDPPIPGFAPETYTGTSIRADNAFVAVTSFQFGSDFSDYNVYVHDMDTGAWVLQFNEHSVATVNRSTCVCPIFEAFLASEAEEGVPQDVLDSYDYRVDVENSFAALINLVWSATGTLLATFQFDVITNTGLGLIGSDQFQFEIATTPPAVGSVEILSCNARVAPYGTMPRNRFANRPLATHPLPGGARVIHYGKQPVRFWPWPAKRLPRWLGGLWPGPEYRKSIGVVGYV